MAPAVTEALRKLDDAKDERRRNTIAVVMYSIATLLFAVAMVYGLYALNCTIPDGPLVGARLLHQWVVGVGAVGTVIYGLCSAARIERMSYRRVEVREANYAYMDAVSDFAALGGVMPRHQELATG